MDATLWGILAGIAGILVLGAGAFVAMGKAQSTGVQLQAASQNATTAAAQAAIAQAEASGPSTADDAAAKLKAGNF